MKHWLVHKGKQLTALALLTILLSSCFAIDRSLFSGLITAKQLWVQACGIMIFAFLAVNIFLTKKTYIKTTDILVATLCICMLTREFSSKMPHANPHRYILDIVMYIAIYFFYRTVGNGLKSLKFIILIYLSITLVQAIIGLLQVHGAFGSYHPLFNITGTFHNPGPFSGFIVSGLPMSFALYLLTKRSKSPTIDNKQPEVSWNKEISSLFLTNKILRSSFWINLVRTANTDILLNYFSQLVIVVLLFVLPAARSRAAWLAGLIGVVLVLYKLKGKELFALRKKNWEKVTRPIVKLVSYSFPIYSSHRRTFLILGRTFAAMVVVVTLTVSLNALYKFKQGSADGRLLIWQVSSEMIKDKPLLGWGQGAFQAKYADYQGEWFSNGRGSEIQEMVAGSPETPFNELVNVAVNYGLIGVGLILLVLYSILSERASIHLRKGDEIPHSYLNSEQRKLAVLLKSGLVSTCVFALFSYPSNVAPLLIQIIMLASLAVNTKPSAGSQAIIPNNISYKIAITGLSLGLIPIYISDLYDRQTGLKHWQEANESYGYELYRGAVKEFALAAKYLPNEGLLWQMQAKSYTMFENWQQGINAAQKAQNYQGGQILNIILGDAYTGLGKYNEAEEAYRHASTIIPHKFYPMYLRAKMYHKSKQHDKAAKLIQELLNKKIKIKSTAIQEMRDELTDIINQREKEQEVIKSKNLEPSAYLPVLKKGGDLTKIRIRR